MAPLPPPNVPTAENERHDSTGRNPTRRHAPAKAPRSPQDASKDLPAELSTSEALNVRKAIRLAAALAVSGRRRGEPLAEAIARTIAEEDWERFGGAPAPAAVMTAAMGWPEKGALPAPVQPDAAEVASQRQKRAAAMERFGLPIYREAIAGTELASQVADAMHDAVDAILGPLSYAELAMVAGLLGNRLFRETLGYHPADLYAFVGRAAAERLADPAWETMQAGIMPE